MEVIVFPDKPSELLFFLSPINVFTIPIEFLNFLVDGPSKIAAILLPLLHTVNGRKISLRILLGIPMILTTIADIRTLIDLIQNIFIDPIGFPLITSTDFFHIPIEFIHIDLLGHSLGLLRLLGHLLSSLILYPESIRNATNQSTNSECLGNGQRTNGRNDPLEASTDNRTNCCGHDDLPPFSKHFQIL